MMRLITSVSTKPERRFHRQAKVQLQSSQTMTGRIGTTTIYTTDPFTQQPRVTWLNRTLKLKGHCLAITLLRISYLHDQIGTHT